MKMNRTTKLINGIILMFLISTTAWAQDAVTIEEIAVDEWGRPKQDLSKLPKMDRDIVILKNVLDELFTNRENQFFFRNNSQGLYVKDLGVMFNINSVSRHGNVVFADDIGTDAVVVGSVRSDDDDEKDERSTEEMNAEMLEMYKSKANEFLLNYGSLLGELKSNEKVLLNIDFQEYQKVEKTKRGQSVIYARSMRNNTGKKRLVSSISASDLEKFANGQMSMDAATNKIDQKVVDLSNNEMADAKIMSGILDNLFETSLDGKLKRRGRTSWSYFDGFGLMFEMKLATKGRNSIIYLSDGGSTSAVGRADKRDDDQEEYFKALEEEFPDFESMVIERILEYGRTLRSVNSNEVVVVNVDFGSLYRKTELPRSMQLMIPKSTIMSYAQGNLSLSKAKESVDIKKLTGSTGSFGNTFQHSFPAVYEAQAVDIATGYSKSKKK